MMLMIMTMPPTTRTITRARTLKDLYPPGFGTFIDQQRFWDSDLCGTFRARFSLKGEVGPVGYSTRAYWSSIKLIANQFLTSVAHWLLGRKLCMD